MEWFPHRTVSPRRFDFAGALNKTMIPDFSKSVRCGTHKPNPIVYVLISSKPAPKSDMEGSTAGAEIGLCTTASKVALTNVGMLILLAFRGIRKVFLVLLVWTVGRKR